MSCARARKARTTRRRKPKLRHGAVCFAVVVWMVFATASAQDSDRSFADVVERVRPAVVSISVTRSLGSEFAWGPERGGTVRQSPSTRGYGSGIILDTEGRILTNRHVIHEAVTIQVRFGDGATASGTLIRPGS